MATSSGLPAHIGPYVPLRKIGQGGMGVVYCARDEREPDRLVALKVISDGGVSQSDDTSRRFLREAKILEGLRHPNIVTFYDIGVHGKQSYFAMELLSGTTLSSFVGKSYRAVLPIFIQICAGMSYLASRRIVHRDLSPDNVFIIEEDGHRLAKILDFGIAKDTAGEDTIHNFTKTGLLMGKPMYWSPEQIGYLAAGEKIDWRSDVYTLGVIFHRILSGALPFHADTPVGYISAHLNEQPDELTAPPGLPLLPEPLVAVIHRMMEKDRIARPQTYKEIVEVFRAVLIEAGETAEELSIEIPAMGEATDVTYPSGRRTGRTKPGSLTPSEDATAEMRPEDVPGEDLRRSMEEDAPTAGLSSRKTGKTKFDRTKPTVVDPTKPTVVRDRTKSTVVGTKPTVVGPVAVGEEEEEAELEEQEARQPARSKVPMIAAAVLLLALAGAGIWKLTRPSADVAEKTPVPVPSKSTGTLAINALPWARVVSVMNDGTHAKVPIGDNLTTPVLLELPPAKYTVELASGLGPETQSVTVEIQAGKTVQQPVSLIPSERAVALLD